MSNSIISFSNGIQAKLTTVPPSAIVKDLIPSLNLDSYNSVIVSIGAADNLDQKLANKLASLFNRGIARGADETKSIIIDGGTQAGVMQLMGTAVAERSRKTQLIGVAPAGLVSYPGGPATGTALESNHTHFVLVEGNEWGVETPFLFKLVIVKK